MAGPYCEDCGTSVDRVSREVDGILKEVYPKFCRKCGGKVFFREVQVVPETETISDQKEVRGFDCTADLDSLRRAIEAAIPENYTDLTRQQLHESIVQSVLKAISEAPSSRYQSGELTRQTPRESGSLRTTSGTLDNRRTPSRELDQRRPSILSSRCSNGNGRSDLRPAQDEHREERCKSYHVTMVDGLTSHVTWTPEEAEELGPQLVKRKYSIDLCDCDRVKYIPSETHPGFIRRAEEALKK
jgi:hypothetical protein